MYILVVPHLISLTILSVPGELAKAFRLTINKVPYSIQKYKSQTIRLRDEYAESQIKL